MTQISRALNNSTLNWFRVNLTKRKELTAFRNIIVDKIKGFNHRNVDCDNESDDESFIEECSQRRCLFPSNNNNVNGYYESVMANIKFSCWVKCSENELLDILNDLNSNHVTADASRKSNSGVIRVVDESEVNTLNWIINTVPQNLYRANSIPSDTLPARLTVQGGAIIDGCLSKMRGKVGTDKFFFSVLDTDLFMVVNKGTVEEVIDFSQEIEKAKYTKENDKINKEIHWMVLRLSRGFEQTLAERLDSISADPMLDFHIETFLPVYMKDIKRNDKVVGQRKSLLCPGYLFIHASISEILRLEIHKSWDGTFISRFLVRQSMRKDGVGSRAMVISDREMTDFKFAVNSNLTNVELDSEDYVDNELVKYFNKDSAFNQRIGRVLHKKDKLYLTFLPIGGMKVANVIPIKSSEIRKLSAKELAEIK